jgi:hypothetical protein
MGLGNELKTLSCSKCFCFLGEMKQGKLHKNTIILCKNCMEYYKACENLADYAKKSHNVEMPDFFKNIFK